MSEILRRSKSPGSEAEASHTAASALIPLIVRNARDLIAFLDVEGRRIYNSPSYAPLLGDPDTLVGSDSFADIHAEDRERVRTVFRDTVCSGSGYRVEYRLVARDGSVRVVQSEGSVIRADEGRVVGVVVVGRDVTEERHAELQLDAALRRQTALADFSLYALRASDPAQVFERAVQLTAEALGVDFCTVLELQPDGRTLRVAAGHNWPQQRLGRNLGAEEGMQSTEALELYSRAGGRSLEAPQPVVLADVRNDERHKNTFRVRELGVVSSASVVIPAPGRPYGTLVAHSCTRREFEPAECEFVQAVANVLAATLARHRAHRALQDSEARKGAILDASIDAVVSMDHLGRIVEFNAAAESHFGYARDYAIGREMAELIIPPELREGHRKGLARFIATGEGRVLGTRIEVPALRADGSRFDAELSIVRIAGSEPPLFTGTARDITARKAAEQALRQSMHVLESTFEHIDQGISIVDPDLRAIGFNRRFRELLDFPESLCKLNTPFADFVRYNAERGDYGPGEVEEQVRTRVELARRFEPHRFERQRPDGAVVEIRGNPVPGGGFVTVYTDVTERARAERALRQSEARFRSLTELSSDWYWEQDERFRFTLIAGPGASAGAGGGDPSVYLGKARWECGDLEPLEGDWALHRARLERHEPFRDAVFRRSMSDGSTRYMSVSGEPVFGEDGRFAGYSGVGSNITQRRLAEQALEQSEQRYRFLFEAGPEAMYLFDRESLAILAVNPRAVELYGWSREQLLCMSMLDVRPPEERAFVEKEVRSTTSNRVRRRRRHWRSNGEVFDAEITSRFVEYAGRPAEMVVIIDVTARQRAEQVLREQRRLLARAQDLAGLGYWEYDPATGAMQGSRELRRMLDLGVDLPSQTAEWSLNLVHPEDREHVRAAVQKAIDLGSSYELEARVLAADGTPRILVISGEAVKDDAGRVTKVIGSCLDITEQRERENALSEAADQLQALSRRLVEAQETERRRLATELHDRVGQNLTALGINLDILARRMSGLDADARHRLEESHSLIVATTRSVAGVLDDLHPPMLDDLGLGPTLRWAAQDFSRRTEIPTKVCMDGVERRIDRQNELALLRIVQEALTNVAKHAGARAVGITLVWQPEALQVEVTDDGAGFECGGSRGHTGLGLATMRERTLAAHGQLDIDSAPGRGTRVRVLVPG